MRKGPILLASLAVIGYGSGYLLAQAPEKALMSDTARMEKYVKKLIIDAKWGNAPGEFEPPDPKVEDPEYDILMKVSPDGHLCITDYQSHDPRIQIFSNEGKFIKAQKCFSGFWVYDFEIDSKGYVYEIGDNGSTGVFRVYNPEGRKIGEFPSKKEGWMGDGKKWILAGGRLFRDVSQNVHALVELNNNSLDIHTNWHEKKLYDLELGVDNELKVKSQVLKDSETVDKLETTDKKGCRWVKVGSWDNIREIQKYDSLGRLVFRMEKPTTDFKIRGRKWWIFGGDVVAFDEAGNFYILSPKASGVSVFKYSQLSK